MNGLLRSSDNARSRSEGGAFQCYNHEIIVCHCGVLLGRAAGCCKRLERSRNVESIHPIKPEYRYVLWDHFLIPCRTFMPSLKLQRLRILTKTRIWSLVKNSEIK